MKMIPQLEYKKFSDAKAGQLISVKGKWCLVVQEGSQMNALAFDGRMFSFADTSENEIVLGFADPILEVDLQQLSRDSAAQSSALYLTADGPVGTIRNGLEGPMQYVVRIIDGSLQRCVSLPHYAWPQLPKWRIGAMDADKALTTLIGTY